MDLEILKTLAQVGGVGCVALGVVMLVFRDIIRQSIFRRLRRDQAVRVLYTIIAATWSIGVVGLGTWAWVETWPDDPVTAQQTGSATVGVGIANTGEQEIGGDVTIGTPPPLLVPTQGEAGDAPTGEGDVPAAPESDGTGTGDATVGTGLANTGTQVIRGTVTIGGGAGEVTD